MLNIGNLMVDSLDYILIVDKHFRIVYNTRYDEALNENSKIYTSGSNTSIFIQSLIETPAASRNAYEPAR